MDPAPKLTKLLEWSSYIYILVDPHTPPSIETHVNSFWRLCNHDMTMSHHVLSQLSVLQAAVGADCEILRDPLDAHFQQRLARWTDIDRKVPAAIVLPRTEDGCLKTVR